MEQKLLQKQTDKCAVPAALREKAACPFLEKKNAQ